MLNRVGQCLCDIPPQRAANMIPAHDSPLAALAFDASGTKLATASEKVEFCVCVFTGLAVLTRTEWPHLYSQIT